MRNRLIVTFTVITLLCALFCRVNAQDSTRHPIIPMDSMHHELDTLRTTLPVDTTIKLTARDTLKPAKRKFLSLPAEHSPKVAALASTFLPGLGQVYNKKYWKVPIIYAGAAVTAYFIYSNYTVYKNFRQAYIAEHDSNPANDVQSFKVWGPGGGNTYYPALYTNDNQISIINQYRGYVDLSVIAGVVLYALNIVDAVVDAHLYHFDVGDNLSLNVTPVRFPAYNHYNTGIAFTLQF